MGIYTRRIFMKEFKQLLMHPDIWLSKGKERGIAIYNVFLHVKENKELFKAICQDRQGLKEVFFELLIKFDRQQEYPDLSCLCGEMLSILSFE